MLRAGRIKRLLQAVSQVFLEANSCWYIEGFPGTNCSKNHNRCWANDRGNMRSAEGSSASLSRTTGTNRGLLELRCLLQQGDQLRFVRNLHVIRVNTPTGALQRN